MVTRPGTLEIEQIDQRNLQNEITSRLARLIAKSPPSSKLPTERELCELLNVSRNSIREAIRSLAFIGAIQVKRGNGIYVASAEEANVERLVSLGLVVQRSSLQDITEARRLIEVDIATLAAENHNQDDRAKLERNLQELTVQKNDVAVTSRLDLEFHGMLAEASHNSVLIYFAKGMSSVIQAWIAVKLDKASNQQEVANEILQEHQEILEAVLARDASLASNCMSAHLVNAAKRLESAIGTDHSFAEEVFALLVPQGRTR